MAISTDDLAHIDVASPSAYADGHPLDAFDRLREQAPVHWHEWTPFDDRFWAVVSYAAVVEASRDPATFSSGVGHVAMWDIDEDALEARRSMIDSDPPQHTRLRRLVSAPFKARSVHAYEDRTRQLVGRLLDDAIAQQQVDFVPAVSAPLPINVILNILGVPAEDAPYLLELTDQLVEATSGRDIDPGAYGNTTDTRLLPFNSPAAWALQEYGSWIGAARRVDPRDDLVSALVHAEVDGDRLSEQEFRNFFQLLVFAGNETTRSTISHGILALAEHPDQMRRLAGGGPDLYATAVEEILRWASAIICFRRTATRDTVLGGREIAAGDRVVLYYNAANYDPTVFDDPQTFDIGRTPNPHLAFGGGGIHHCLGAFLARLEVRVLLEEIVRRRVRFVLDGPPIRVRSNFVSGFESLPVRAVTLDRG